MERWLAEMPPDTRLIATLWGIAVMIFVSLGYANNYSLFLLCLSKARRLVAQRRLLLRWQVERKWWKIHWQIHSLQTHRWKIKQTNTNSNICRVFIQFWLYLYIIFRCSWHQIKILVCVERRTEAGSSVFDLNTLHSKPGVMHSIGKVAFELDSLLLMIISSKKTPAFSTKDIGSSSRLLFLGTPNPSS